MKKTAIVLLATSLFTLTNCKKTEDVKQENVSVEKTEINSVTKNNFEGEYHTDITGKNYNQILKLKAVNDSVYHVKITFTGAKKGCEFEGKGQLINNQIDVKLSTVQPKLKGIMTVQFKDNNKIAEVFTSKFDERFDLMYFCGGGASLAGDYTKK